MNITTANALIASAADAWDGAGLDHAISHFPIEWSWIENEYLRGQVELIDTMIDEPILGEDTGEPLITEDRRALIVTAIRNRVALNEGNARTSTEPIKATEPEEVDWEARAALGWKRAEAAVTEADRALTHAKNARAWILKVNTEKQKPSLSQIDGGWRVSFPACLPENYVKGVAIAPYVARTFGNMQAALDYMSETINQIAQED